MEVKPMDEDIFYCLKDLLVQGTDLAVLATAIEQHGLFGFDRFGRCGAIKPSSYDAERALDALARVHAEINDIDGSSVYPGWEFEDYPSDLCSYGWYEAELPDFKAIFKEIEPTLRPSNKQRFENNNTLLIGLLLHYIQDGFQRQKHPLFSTIEELCQDLAFVADHRNGMGEGTLKKKFKEGKELVSRILGPQIRV